MGSLMAYKATVPRHHSAREPDLLLNPGDPQTGPFFSQHLQAAFGSLHLLSKRPRTGQHFVHSKTMQGISLLRQLDPFQRRRAAKFPPPAPSSETRCKFGPWRPSVCFYFCPCCLLEVGRKGPSPLPSQARVECPRERVGSVPERTRGVSSPQMQQVEATATGVGLQVPVPPSWWLLVSGQSAPDRLHRAGDSWAVASCDLFIFSSLIASPYFLLFMSKAVGRRLLIWAVGSQFFCLPLPLPKASAEGSAPPPLPGPQPLAEICFLTHHPGNIAGHSSASFLWLELMDRKGGAFLCCLSAGKGKSISRG